ncbi:FUSC family protein [Wansuia hejianensis]|uniref:FUSC family protein n=1 Tax=Wansuia hejianensis TaxID=2763667 RepID=A0A926EZR9_9FIRM|nr:aromatic acid exporter family protein [Wansuia hejianensis]MBC8591383.1 FUSC family protein [Wansuia hejianensis]
MKFTKIGMRTIKTAVSVILTLIIAEVFKLQSPTLAVIAAVMTMESSVSESFVAGKNRMYGTLLGGAVALIMSYIAPTNLIFIGIGLIILINICNYFQWEKAVKMAMVVFLVIVLGYGEQDRYGYALHRTLDTLVGVIVGTSINYFVRPPKVEKNVENTINQMYEEVREILKKLIWKGEFTELDNFKKEIVEVEEKYEIFVDDMKYHMIENNNIDKYQHLFNSLENIQDHLSVINDIKPFPNINEANKDFIERYFNKEVPNGDFQEMDHLDLIYNYHLEKILKEVDYIESTI